MYDHDPSEVDALGWAEFVGRQWDAIFAGYRSGRGRRSLCRAWVDLLEAGLGCSQQLADLLVRAEVMDRADRDLEGTRDAQALLAGMGQLIADVGDDLLDLAQESGRSTAGLLDAYARLAAFLDDYAFASDSAE